MNPTTVAKIFEVNSACRISRVYCTRYKTPPQWRPRQQCLSSLVRAIPFEKLVAGVYGAPEKKMPRDGQRMVPISLRGGLPKRQISLRGGVKPDHPTIAG